MWNKIIDLLVQWVRDRPRNDLLDRLLALLDSMAECDRTWRRWEEARNAGDEQERSRRYREWRGAVGELDGAISVLDEVLRIYDPEAHDSVTIYAVSERAPNPEDGETVVAAAVAMTGTQPASAEAAIAGMDFPTARRRLDTFIKNTFKPEEIAAARASILRQSGFA